MLTVIYDFATGLMARKTQRKREEVKKQSTLCHHKSNQTQDLQRVRSRDLHSIKINEKDAFFSSFAASLNGL